MQLNAIDALKIFRAAGLETLYHANTVRTTSTFFQSGRLLPRGTVVNRGLDQTHQTSDSDDQSLNLWYDIFFDGSDLHENLRRVNHYGPISLRFDPDLLQREELPGVWVTRSNPAGWIKYNVPEANRWFQSLDQLSRFYSPTNFDYHIVLRNAVDGVPLIPYLQGAVLDKTARTPFGKTDTYTRLGGRAINQAARDGGLVGIGIQANVRTCPALCNCTQEYKDMGSMRLDKFFISI